METINYLLDGPNQGSNDCESRAGKYTIGSQVKHRIFGFRGVIFDVDPVFSNSEEWYESIPEDFRPKKEQPFYHLLAETPEKAPYVAYVSEQNLILDDEGEDPISHPEMEEYFEDIVDGRFVLRSKAN
jgi:heat shock protein HspQ